MPAIIVRGDRTSHGGEVIQGSPVSDIHGKPIARIGDRVTCPLHGHGGITEIVSGDPTLIIDGKPVARNGDKTACGATLISSQATTTDDPGRGYSSSSNSAAAVASGSAFLRSSTASTSEAVRYDIHFLVQDNVTGDPLSNVPYRLTLPSGEEVVGSTDINGLTSTIASDTPQEATLEAPFYGDISRNAYSNDEHDACCH